MNTGAGVTPSYSTLDPEEGLELWSRALACRMGIILSHFGEQLRGLEEIILVDKFIVVLACA